MYLIDGIEVEKKDFILPVENIGVWRGDGIFEAIRIHEGYPFGIDLHIERFKKSASKVFFDNINFEKIKRDILLVAENFQNGYVRTLILRNEKDTFNVYCFYQPPIKLPRNFTLQTQKAYWQGGGDFLEQDVFNIGTKSTSYAMNISHTRLAESNGYTDALLVNRENIILEGPTWTFGWILNDKIHIPDLDLGILDSITRQYLLRFGVEKKLDVSIGRLAKDELENIQCGFVLSTAKHAVPVTKINEIEYPQHPLINEIQKMFKDEVNKERS